MAVSARSGAGGIPVGRLKRSEELTGMSVEIAGYSRELGAPQLTRANARQPRRTSGLRRC